MSKKFPSLTEIKEKYHEDDSRNKKLIHGDCNAGIFIIMKNPNGPSGPDESHSFVFKTKESLDEHIESLIERREKRWGKNAK